MEDADVSPEIELWLLVAICGLATFAWRGAGVFVSGGINPNSALFSWLGCIAYATLAALISRIMFLPVGTLAQTALSDRLLAATVAALVFVATGKNLFAGVFTGGAALLAITWLARGG
jgi:branched-subunit amino acid transport protein